MLVLTREIGETVIIGDSIRVTILDVREGRKVRVGIEAPQNIAVDRLEIRERKDRERR